MHPERIQAIGGVEVGVVVWIVFEIVGEVRVEVRVLVCVPLPLFSPVTGSRIVVVITDGVGCCPSMLLCMPPPAPSSLDVFFLFWITPTTTPTITPTSTSAETTAIARPLVVRYHGVDLGPSFRSPSVEGAVWPCVTGSSPRSAYQL